MNEIKLLGRISDNLLELRELYGGNSGFDELLEKIDDDVCTLKTLIKENQGN